MFKSLKANYYKACKKHILDNPGRVVTTDVIASLLAAAWPQSLTPLNIMVGFKKCGVYPLNPGEVTDRQIAPLNLFPPEKNVASTSETKSTGPESKHEGDKAVLSSPLPSSDRYSIFKMRYEEGYDIYDDEYVAWLQKHHPDSVPKLGATSSKVVSSSLGSSSKSPEYSTGSKSVCSTHCGSSTTPSSMLSEILSVPKPKTQTKKEKTGF